MNKKALLAKFLDKTFMLQLSSKLTAPNLMVFNYHRIYKKEIVTSFDEGVFAHSENVFIDQLIWIKNNFTIISENELINTIESGKWFDKKTALITFDDGYIDNYELAYPILKNMNVPAIFYIPCDQINGHAISWWDQVAFIIKSSTKKTFYYEGKTIINEDNNSKSAIKSVLRLFKDNSYSDINKQLHDLSVACEVEKSSLENVKKQFMNWDQIKEVSSNNIAIGSHTMSHRILSSLSESEQRFEITESKLILEDMIDRPVNTISYPVGGLHTFNELTKRIVTEAGYKIAFSFIAGKNPSLESTDILSIKRVELSQDSSTYKSQALMPDLFL